MYNDNLFSSVLESVVQTVFDQILAKNRFRSLLSSYSALVSGITIFITCLIFKIFTTLSGLAQLKLITLADVSSNNNAI